MAAPWDELPAATLLWGKCRACWSAALKLSGSRPAASMAASTSSSSAKKYVIMGLEPAPLPLLLAPTLLAVLLLLLPARTLPPLARGVATASDSAAATCRGRPKASDGRMVGEEGEEATRGAAWCGDGERSYMCCGQTGESRGWDKARRITKRGEGRGA